jgi:hypothetical protein
MTDPTYAFALDAFAKDTGAFTIGSQSGVIGSIEIYTNHPTPGRMAGASYAFAIPSVLAKHTGDVRVVRFADYRHRSLPQVI